LGKIPVAKRAEEEHSPTVRGASQYDDPGGAFAVHVGLGQSCSSADAISSREVYCWVEKAPRKRLKSNDRRQHERGRKGSPESLVLPEQRWGAPCTESDPCVSIPRSGC